MSVTIYHNPRCSKSRQTLQLLEDKGLDPIIIEYLDSPPTAEQLQQTLHMLDMGPRDLIRKNEAAYKNAGLNNEALSDEELIDVMLTNPILIERPIVIANNQARIGRPPESVLEIL
jgi:arsenate reductase